MKHARLLDMENGSRSLTVDENATLADVLAAAGVEQGDRVLSQNGRKATALDPVKDQATVMLMPRAEHA